MFELTVTGAFSAAHFLAKYPGPCANLHGHNYGVEVAVAGEHVNEIGICVDFKDLKARLADVLSKLDHTNLNEFPPFAGRGPENNPSSENLAVHIYTEMKLRLKNLPVRVTRVTVHESDNASVSYSPNAGA